MRIDKKTTPPTIGVVKAQNKNQKKKQQLKKEMANTEVEQQEFSQQPKRNFGASPEKSERKTTQKVDYIYVQAIEN